MKRTMAMVFLVVLSLLINSTVPAQKLKTGNAAKLQKSSIKYNYINAFYDGSGVYLEWQTEYETKNFGFFVYRVSGGEKALVSESFIAGSSPQSPEGRSAGKNYNFYDADGDGNSRYVVESVDIYNFRRSTGEISPDFINDLSEVAGNKSEPAAKVKRNFRQQSERSELDLPKDLQEEFDSYKSLPDADAQRAVSAQAGVKIGVKKEGLHRVTRAQLAAAGFDVNADSGTWKLFMNGVEQAIIVGGNGDYIEFYGKTLDTPESDTQYYFLIAGGASGKRMNTTALRPIAGRVPARNYNQAFIFKERTNYFNSILNGDAENYFGRIVNNVGATITFNLNAVDFSIPEAVMRLSLQGGTITAHEIKVTLNDQELASVTGNYNELLTKEYRISTQLLREGANTLKLTAVTGTSLFDSVRINYNRRYTAQQNQLFFYTQNYKEANLDGFTSANIRVFDMTDSNNPSLLNNLKVQQSANGFGVTVPSHRGRVMYAVEDAAVLTPASVTANNASNLATAAHNAELVVISHKNFLTQAGAWANHRRSQGVTAEVVDVEDVFDEFSFGAPTALAIRGFLQYAKSNWQTPPKYVLLVGDASNDPRNYRGYGYYNLVPTKLVDTLYSETGSDDSLADFNNDGLAELAIGRIPARTPQDVTDALAKVTNFEASVAQAHARGALFASDQTDAYYNFEEFSQRLAGNLPATMPKTFVNRATPNSQAILVNELNSGRFLVNYSGHGNIAVWASTGFFGKTNAQQLSNANNLSVFVMLSCLNGFFIDPQEDGLSETLLKTNSGGAVAAWSSTGLTTPDIQEIMATRFYKQISAGNITRLGDLINDAKTTISSGRDVRLSWVLLGDPMLRMK
ncbi:MAG TPA: C25 family cysteine peptidase [Pyrinomonadaceae bacterium]|jgi:hypothetical protein